MKKFSMFAGAFVVALSASSAAFATAPSCPPGSTGTPPNCVQGNTGATAVPEPGTLALLGLGIAGAVVVARRKGKSKDKKNDE